MTTARTGITLDLRDSWYDAREVWATGTKTAALARLAAVRGCGLNRDRDIEVRRGETRLFRFWVVSRPDHFNGVTYLMTADGSWVPGRLTGQQPCFCETWCRGGHPAPWTRLSGPVEPAGVTHDYEYATGRVGISDGHGNTLVTVGWDGSAVEQTAWAAWAWCVACGWSTCDDREDTVRAYARWHRANPTEYPDHAVPRRIFTVPKEQS